MARSFENWRSYQRARKSADFALMAKPNVVGTGYGVKFVKGKPTTDPCFTIFVTRKRPLGLLRKASRVPETVVRLGRRWLTDVVEVGEIVKESALRILDRRDEIGTCNLLARWGNQPVCVTCAHAIAGLDSSVFDDLEEVSLKVPGELGTVMGVSVAGEESHGRGYDLDYGEFDAGLIGNLRPGVADLFDNGQRVQVYRPTSPEGLDMELFGEPVTGHGSVSGHLESFIRHTRISLIDGSRIDLVIGDGTADMTTSGDSGLCWRLRDGRLVGMHFAGDRRQGSNRSVRSMAMLACRFVDRFDLDDLILL